MVLPSSTLSCRFPTEERGSLIRTFQVLAGAYAGKRGPAKSALTHAAELDVSGYPSRVLCKRVDVDHLCPDLSSSEVPTCPVCRRKVRGASPVLAPGSVRG